MPVKVQGDSQSQERPRRARPYRGEVVYIYAFDLAYDMKRQPLERLLGRPTEGYSIGPSKRSPKRAFFYRPETVRLEVERRQGPHGTVEIQRSVKVFSVGAVSIQIRVPFEVDHIEELVDYHDLTFDTGSLEQEVGDLAEKVRRELEPYCIRPVARLEEGEAYTAFCLHTLPQTVGGQDAFAEDWLASHRRRVAALLNQEPDAARLSEQETAESTGQYLSYYESDLVVLDWDAALVVGGLESLDDVLHIMELANVQLVELAAYDRILDGSMEASYRDMAGRAPRGRWQIQRGLREIRVDLARLSDELLNITKFFGDWHLARIYQALSNRFHLADWCGTIREKLKTLGDLYDVLQQDRFNFWMVVLEVSIVLLFILDVILLLLGL